MATKTDMERVGLFKELGYHTIGDKFKSTNTLEFNVSATKGKQMLPGGSKSKNATSAGYFSDFSRVFSGEAMSDPIKIRRQQRAQSFKKNLGRDWVPPAAPKDQSGIGSCYGTFSGPIEHFAGIGRTLKSDKTKAKNIITSPAKLGTGYGYAGVTLNKYPEYKGNTYGHNYVLLKRENANHKAKMSGKGVFRLNMCPTEFFEPNPYKGTGVSKRRHSAPSSMKNKDLKPFKPTSPAKKDGGMKAGCFDPFPQQSKDPYKVYRYTRPIHVVNNTGKIFYYSAGPKGKPQESVMHQSITKEVTPMNYKSVQRIMAY